MAIDFKSAWRGTAASLTDVDDIRATAAQASTGTDNQTYMTPLRTREALLSSVGSIVASAVQGQRADTALQSVVAGANVSIDATDPRNPVISSTGGGGGGGSGTVTSVNVAAASGSRLTATGGPVTTAGLITIGVESGYRLITNAEAAELGAAVLEVLPGTNVSIDNSDPRRPVINSTGSGGGGGGDVSGPTSAVADRIAVFNGTTGKVIKDGGTTIAALNASINAKFTQPSGTTAQYLRGDGSLATFPTLGTMAAKNSVAISDISATGTPGSGNYLRGDGTWSSPGAGSGTVTSVGIAVPVGMSVAGSPVTTSGTITLSYATGYQGYTATEATKLSGISAGADVTNATNVGAAIHGRSGKTTLANADTFAIIDSAASNILQKITWQNIRTVLDGIYALASSVLSIATQSEVRAGTQTTKALGVKQTWDAYASVTLADATNIVVDFALGINFDVTITGNRTLNNPSNVKLGQSGQITVSRAAAQTLSFGGNWKAFGNTALPASGKSFKVVYYALTGTEVHYTIVPEA